MKELANMTFVDLFAGIGGFRIALEKFGAKCVFTSEWDKYAQKTYETNFGETPKGDISLISEKDISPHDILCAGFPCQAFSISGKQQGFEDSRGTLFFEIARIVKCHKPKILFLENVANLKNHSDGKSILRMVEILEDMGYKVFYEVLNASNYGVPQSRKRVYFIAFRQNLHVENFEFPLPTNEDVALEDILVSNNEASNYIINREDIMLKNIEVAERANRPIRVGIINKGGQGDRIYSPKGHAITLSAYGGGSGAKTGAYLVDGVIRKLSPKECLAALGFPEGYILPVSDSQAWKQCGNSVAVPVLIKIMEQVVSNASVMKMMTNLKRDSIKKVG
ncbi:DNA (cytosine-5-)-methyltransferase [Herbivorax sp. ANBcel31]|uniref:DNA (cytosine-5-)-methyltransferase n=1 Tax=Herbivorax sp. ANBcel31 TaxID=3069754 RepID=UPI0027AEDCC0|nr:DNA (cytosine-5-)-methyltransferase [Herbivorax sp. ANBcel31]MDQ2085145.1 DNA (cytosine-5-)-methyltransferase [Herbivorax sp. ANBcel31]